MLGPEHPDTLASMNNLANVYRWQGKYAQAEALYSQTLEIRRRVLGPEHPDTLSFHEQSGARSTFHRASIAQAEALHSQTLEIQRRVLGPEHPDTLGSMNNLAASTRAGQVRAGRGARTAKPWRSSAACWVPSIPTR